MTSQGSPFPIGLAIGPMRTGSTWLYQYLLMRNDVCVPKDIKETFYFDVNYARGEAWYRNHFRHYDPVRHHSIIEVCPTLFNNHEAVTRVKKTLHKPTLAVSLRDPIDRTWSHYMHLRQYGKTLLEFDNAVRRFPSIVAPSLYAEHLARWLDEFGRENIHIMFYDDLKQCQDEYARKIDKAFGLPPSLLKILPSKEINSGRLPSNPLLAKIVHPVVAKLHKGGLHWIVNTGKRIGLSNVILGRSNHTTIPSMNLGTHSYLVEQFSPDIENLEKLLNINLDSWRRKWVAFREEPDHA